MVVGQLYVPPAVDLAHLVAIRVEAQQRHGGAIVEEAQRRQKIDNLHFELGHILKLDYCNRSSSQEEAKVCRESSEPLWEALDDIVSRMQLPSSTLTVLGGETLRQVSARGLKGDDEVWKEFWEHYRHCRSRSEEPNVLRGSAMSARGARKWGLGSAALSARIRSASENFRCHERTCEALPASVAVSRAETPLEHNSRPLKDKDLPLPQRATAMTPMTPQKPWTPSTKLDEHGLSTSRPCSKANHRPGSKDPKQKPNVEPYKEPRKDAVTDFKKKCASSIFEWGFVTDTYAEEESALNVSSTGFKNDTGVIGSARLPPDTGAIGSARLPPLKGFRDYKDRKNTSCRVADKDMVEELDCSSPRILTAAREVHSVREYRRSRTQESWKSPVQRRRTCSGIGERNNRTPRDHKRFSRRASCDGSIPERATSDCKEQEVGSDCPPVLAFHRPWSREQTTRLDLQKKPFEAGTRLTSVERFAELCRSIGVHPKPASVLFLVKLLPALDLRDAGYADQDILALAAALPYRDASRIESVDLSENPRLTDSSVCDFLQALADMHAKTLKRISLNSCSHLTCRTASLVTRLLQERFVALETIDISGITISSADYQKFARNISEQKRLRDVRLCNTGLGFVGTSIAKTIVTSLIRPGQLHALDLGWNSLDTFVFKALGEAVVAQKRLTSLSLANTGSCREPKLNGSPLLVFLEHLASDRRLAALDVSNNALDQSAPFVLEWALSCHPTLQSVNISSNPIGLHGKRSLLRLIAGSLNPNLTRIEMNNCNAIVSDEADRNSFGCDPSGHYAIPLEQPAQRAFVLILFMRLTLQHDVPLSRLVSNAIIRLDGIDTPFDVQTLRSGNISAWRVPSHGELRFTLDASAAFFKDHSSLPIQALEFCIRRSRLEINVMSKTHALLGAVKGVTNEQDWCQLLEALSYDFVLTPEQIKGLCITRLSKATCGNQSASTLCRLLPCLVNEQVSCVASACTRSLHEIMHVHRTCQALFSVNFDNPTKSYSLNLSVPCERCIATRLVLLNRWELQLWQSRDCLDISQHGNAKNFRNIMHSEQVFPWDASEWRLPTQNKLSFDYVSLQRPPLHAQPITNELWCEMIAHVSRLLFGCEDQESQLSSFHVKEALCALSSGFWISCTQLRELLCLFHDSRVRQQLLASFFLRAVDWPANGKVCRSKFTKKDWLELQHRLGHLQTFFYLQPEDLSVSLDLSVYEQRRILNMLVSLTAVEHPGNLRNARIRDADPSSSWDNFAAGIPKSWKKMENCPTHGIFEATYVCSQESKQLRARRRLALEVGGWQTLPEDLEELDRVVQWWSVLDDMPSELVSWLDFLVSNFTSLDQAFDACDASKDGRMNLREFLAGMQQLGFRLPLEPGVKKKKGGKRSIKETNMSSKASSSRSDEEIRVLTAVYRFLDPNGDGEVTSKEWRALSGLWRELLRTTWEFVCHLCLTFASIECAWHVADKDGSGVLTNDEFIDFSSRTKFQGSVQQVYMYLDRDDNGSIGMAEWMALDCISRPDW